MDHRPDKRARYKRELSGVDYIHCFDIDVDKRDIFLFGHDEYIDWELEEEPGVEWAMANRFIRNIRILQALGDEPILIHMKTCGGDWSEGMAIYDAIASCPSHVTILSYTHARSMSSIILQAADRRALMPHSTFMFHDGTFGTIGTVKQAMADVGQLKVSERQMMDVYLDRLCESNFWRAKSRPQIERWLRAQMDKKEDVHLSPEQAVEMGFADLVFGEEGRYDWGALRG